MLKRGPWLRHILSGGFLRAKNGFFPSAGLHFLVRHLRFLFVLEPGTEEKKMSENRTRFRLDQRRAPIYEALERFRQMRVVPFDVPGHKRGRGNPELTAFLGQ